MLGAQSLTAGSNVVLGNRRSRYVTPKSLRSRLVTRSTASDEVELLESLLAAAKERKEKGNAVADAGSKSSGGSRYEGPSFNVKTFNAISPVGLQKYPSGKYSVSGDDSKLPGDQMAIMLRSHKLQESEVPKTVRCIARCGAGTNNIPVKEMTAKGIPVFNTPGANANAVKELVVAGMLVASRDLLGGWKHTKEVIRPEEKEYDKIAKRIEKDKAKFGGVEIAGKTVGVIGLGQIGMRVCEAALALDMNVVGFDPALSVDAAFRLPNNINKVSNLDDLYAKADYICLHVPYIPGVTHHLIDEVALSKCKPGVHILNFARGEIVNGEALNAKRRSGTWSGKYVSDFADEFIGDEPWHIVFPHLGASTEEAEENSAAMAAETIMSFLQTGSIKNSVNFPEVMLPPQPLGGYRIAITHKNEPGVLGSITTYLGDKGINISQQMNGSRGDIAYTVIDTSTAPDADTIQAELLQGQPAIISLRFIGDVFNDDFGTPGTFFFVRWAE